MVDFGEVVIFSREPEDGGVRLAICSRVTGAGKGGGGLERGEERSAEEADLLAGDNDAGAGAKVLLRGCGGRRRGVLCGEEIDELRPVRGTSRAGCSRFGIEGNKSVEAAAIAGEPAQKSTKSRLMPGRDGDGMTVGEMQRDHFPFEQWGEALNPESIENRLC